ncbi:MAG: bifunctional diguanylate cyclase/phosphodiesterase [Sphingobium sp.]
MPLLRRFPAQYLLPLSLLVGLCFGAILILLFVTTSSLDRMEAARERKTLAAAIDTSVEMVQHDLQDYAMWDDAVRHIAADFDPAWVDSNVTAYLGRTQGYNYLFVIGPDGANRYAFGRDDAKPGSAIATLGPSFASGLSAVRRMNPKAPPVFSGITSQDGRLYIYAVAGIVPLTDQVKLPPGGMNFIAIADEIDAAFLDKIRRAHQLPGLSLRKATDGSTADMVPLKDFGGSALAFIDMPLRKPGTALRDQVLPGLVLIMLGAFIAAGFVLRQGGLTIAALQKSQASALHHANHDPLTGLPNRRALLECIKKRLEAGREIGVIYMDLDEFKSVNELYGHQSGDDLLRGAADRIGKVTGPGAMVARMGGDEFAVLQIDHSQIDAVTMADRLIDAFQSSFAIGGTNIRSGVSMGVVMTPPRSILAVDEIMRRADVAMYNVKARGKNRWISYEPGMDANHAVRIRLEQDLRVAVELGQIDVVYQPIVSTKTGEISAVEALARWTHHKEGEISPDVFIPLAEVAGLISALGEHVLANACRVVGPLGLDLSVNLSPAQFWDAHLARQIEDVLKDANFPPHRLELEVTETYLVRRPDTAAAVIEDLRKMGVSMALDDFGCGFASIGYLRQMKFDRLKIDKQFVAEAEVDHDAAELLVAMVALGRALDLEITAEGVQTLEQATLLRACGCHRMQGWLHGRPMSGAALAELVGTRRSHGTPLPAWNI